MSRYARANIRSMQGYSWGEQPEDDQTIKLNTNENPYPPSPRVATAMAALATQALRTYPNPTALPLRQVLAEHHGVNADQIVVTNGGDEALRLAFTTFVEVGGTFAMAEPSYSLYPVLANIHDAKIFSFELAEDWSLPVDTAEQLNQAGVELTCIVNPHAPSGHLSSPDVLAALAADLNGVLLIDEAYIDFVEPSLNYTSQNLLERFDNVLLLRTFSKGYSLAGLRLGYLLGHAELIDPILSKTRDSYNVDHISQQLGEAAFRDQDYAQETWQAVRQERQRCQQHLGQLGLASPPSQSNFLLTSVPASAPLSAAELYQALKDAGILVRYFDTPRLADKLRISIGTEAENNRLVDKLTELLT